MTDQSRTTRLLKPDWAESVVSIPHPTEPGKRVIGFKVDNLAAYPSNWLFKLQDYLRGRTITHSA